MKAKKTAMVMAGRATLAVFFASWTLRLSAEEKASFCEQVFAYLDAQEKVSVFENSSFELAASRKLVVHHFTRNWEEELQPIRTDNLEASIRHAARRRLVLAAFCRAMGRVKAEEAIPLLIQHMDFLCYEDEARMLADRPRTYIEGRVAFKALLDIGEPAFEPVVEHIVAMIGKTTDSSKLGFYRAALKKIAVKILGMEKAKLYLLELMFDQEDADVRTQIREVLARMPKMRSVLVNREGKMTLGNVREYNDFEELIKNNYFEDYYDNTALDTIDSGERVVVFTIFRGGFVTFTGKVKQNERFNKIQFRPNLFGEHIYGDVLSTTMLQEIIDMLGKNMTKTMVVIKVREGVVVSARLREIVDMCKKAGLTKISIVGEQYFK